MKIFARWGVAAVAVVLLSPSFAFAIVPPHETMRVVPGVAGLRMLDVAPTLEIYGRGTRQAADLASFQRFFAHHTGEWEIRMDTRSARPNLIEGAGIPLLPGKGNRLTREDLKLDHPGDLTVKDVETRVRAFLARFPEVLHVAPGQLRLDEKSSAQAGPDGRFWAIELQQFYKGIPVEGAKVFFRISQGNIVQFGAEKVAAVRLDTKARIGREEAFGRALAGLGVGLFEKTEIVDAGELRIYPTLVAGEAPAMRYAGAPGKGYDHVLAWKLAFRREGDPATWSAVVDARTGNLLQLEDLNDYATVTGGIYPTTNTDPEVVRGLPFANVTNGGTKVTDASGTYSYSAGNATSTLNGKYIRMSDNCGSISLTSATGNIAFGTSGGTDCTTPGSGGAGNTHATRSGFYHLTNINRKAAGFLPLNGWLAGTLTANMNINNTCNAFWNGSTVNFYRSGGGCSNTGEIAAVFLHEWGHGMDTNSGGAASDKGTGEAVGDTFAFLETKSSCIGPNFRPGVPCTNCTTCTGVRDMQDFSTLGTKTIAKPSTVADNNGINCDRFTCPYLSGGITAYQGPMGYEGHCESYIASSANWDLAQSLVTRWGTTTGWQKMDAIWYKSLTPSKSAYRVVSGGKCNPGATVDGCAASNWYTVFLAADDDDGNLANGTPNGCRIWDAYTAHGIACGARPTCTQ